MTQIVISSGHSLHVRGAADIVDEVDEARKIVKTVGGYLRKLGVEVTTYNDDISTSQDENLNRIVDFHNAQPPHEIDVSVHLNSSDGGTTDDPIGVEVLYFSQDQLAEELSAAMADAGHLKDRGGKFRDNLYFLENTSARAVLIETIFVNSHADVDAYHEHYEAICMAIAATLASALEWFDMPDKPAPPPAVEGTDVLFHAIGSCSHFGGPEDMGVADDEGLAFIYDVMDAPQLFLPEGTPGTEGFGLARRLNIHVHYCACRWDYSVTPKPSLLEDYALVRNTKTGLALRAFCADWGPHEEKTGRAADLSPSLMYDLGLTTDDEVEVIFPFRVEEA